jgi:hypothetical protein
MKYFRVRNWERWQTFRNDRGPPPWIKVYRDLLHDPEWISLTDAQRGQLVSIWLVASRKQGVCRLDARWIQQQAGMIRPPDLQFFADHGFIEILDTHPVTDCPQDDRTEGRGRGEEIREEGETPVDKSLSLSPPRRSNGHDTRAFDVVKAHVKELIGKLKTQDANELFRLGGQSRKLSAKQIRVALQQLREDREI